MTYHITLTIIKLADPLPGSRFLPEMPEKILVQCAANDSSDGFSFFVPKSVGQCLRLGQQLKVKVL